MKLFRLTSRFPIITLTLLLCGSGLSAYPAEDPLKTLKPTHPRVLIEAHHWPALKAKAETDPLLAQYIAQLLVEADQLLEAPPLERRKQGRRLLSVSREAFRRISIWATARHLADEPRYAERAEAEMRQLIQFSDWNPSHFLDVAEMTAALAIGYDWLYNDLDAAARETIRKGIVRLGLTPAVQAIRNDAWWASRDINWNQVCLGGLTMGALAVADESPEVARKILRAAREGIPNGLSVYAPDGVYPEGPGYWGYGTVYQCLMIDAVRSGLGTSWDMEKTPGFLPSGRAQVQLTGPTGRFFNFSDGREGPSLQAAMFWFARELGEPELLYQQRGLLQSRLSREGSRGPGILPLIWWPDKATDAAPASLPRAWLGEGHTPVAVFRSSWSDPDAFYLACKAGKGSESHAHLDAGSFVLEADGVRWAVDLGHQGYHDLESKGIQLWDNSQNGNRWDVFRLNNRSHNTLTINDQLHRVDGRARFTYIDESTAKIDLSPVFKGQAEKVWRHFEITGHNMTLTDNLQGLEPGAKVRWTMATRADVAIDGAQATLRQDGKRMQVTLDSQSDGRLKVIPADPPDDGFNAANPGTSLLIVDALAPDSGAVTIEVQFKPNDL
ncbi:heparinase II/III domain-containing protein [Coraliomargarita sinensis]|nr:heparinase II/III family protein [Coraliomargarita sinensis]